MINTSKGMSSVYIGKMVGVSQKTAWKICHAIREMMDMSHEKAPALKGIVEVDEKYLGGKQTSSALCQRGCLSVESSAIRPAGKRQDKNGGIAL
jgi:hypothetical protein